MTDKKYIHPSEFSPSQIFSDMGIQVNDKTFCIMPFIHMSTMPNGEYRLCCRSQRVGEVNHSEYVKQFGIDDTVPDITNETTPKKIFQGELYNTIRQELISGVRHHRCSACWNLEDRGIVSLRQSQNVERVQRYATRVKEFVETGTMPWNVPILELKLSNICNLRCRMCFPKDSTPWVSTWEHIKHIHSDGDRKYHERVFELNNLKNKPILNLFDSNPEVVDDLLENLANIEELEFAGGEPLLDPLHFKIINSIKHPEKVILKYSTNLTNLEFKSGRNILDIWKKFKGIRLTISIDGPEHLNNVIRKNSNWSDIKRNINLCKEHLGDKLLTIRATTTISAMNVKHLEETMDAVTGELGILWHTSRLTYPNFLSASVVHVDDLLTAKHRLERRVMLYKKQNSLSGITRDRVDYNQALIRHLTDSINWINHCIKNNQHDQLNNKYIEFTSILDELDKTGQ